MGRAGLVFGLGAALAFIGSILLPIPLLNLIVAFVSVIALGWGAGRTAAKLTGAAAGQGTGRGAGAGAIAGLIQLVLLTAALLVLVNIPAVQAQLNLALQQAAQQNPELGGSGLTGAAVGNAVGITAGLLCGGINFILMLIGGLIGGATWRGAPAAGEYVAAGRMGGTGSTDYGTGSTYNAPSSTGTGYGTASSYDTPSNTGTGYGTASTYDAPSSTGTGTSYGQAGTTTDYSQPGTTGTGYNQGNNPPEGEGGVRVYDDTDRNRS